MTVRTVSFKPPGLTHLGGYEVDAFVAEYEVEDDTLDFRFELGASVGIYWALPAAPNDRLRVILVDGAAFFVDEPQLALDPFCGVVPRFEWKGPLLELQRGRSLVGVTFEASLRPARYRCEFSVLGQDGHDELIVREWTRTMPGGLASLRTWLAILEAHLQLPEGDVEDLELAAGTLYEQQQLTATQRDLVLDVVKAVRAGGDPIKAKRAAQACRAALG